MKYVVGFGALLALVLLVVLVPPHLQVRGLDVDIPASDVIDQQGSQDADYPVAVSFINTAQQTSGIGTIGHPGILITWQSGKQFLIDAGMDRQSAIEFGSLMEFLFGAEPTQTFGPIEEQLGEAINNIEGIGFTHLHIDHTQGISAICNAMQDPATIFQTTDQANEQNLHTEDGQALVESSS